MNQIDYHLEQALVQSIVWTCIASLVLACLLGLYAARRISSPLVVMKKKAQRMALGELEVEIQTEGKDELAELGMSLNDLAKQLKRQEEMRVTMTEDIAHELRTPLATLKSHMRAFEDGIWEPTPERIHSCYEEIERLTQLVGELEELTHMESPAFSLDRTTTNVKELVTQCSYLMQAAFIEKKVCLKILVPGSLELELDRARFIQIMFNLLSNALRHTPPGGEVSVYVYDEINSVLLEVRDTGKGIPEEDLPFIFERFYKGDKSRNRSTGGSGLGLTIVQKLVTAHGGRIWAQAGKGARFYMEFFK